jgi:alcohol dehydrogenase class IV
MDASLAGRFSPEEKSVDLAALLASAAESYLSPRSSFFSDVQSSAALGAVASLIRKAKERSSEPEFRSRMIEAAVLCSFSTGLTAPGPVSVLSWAVAGAAGLSKAAASAVLLPWMLESPFFSGSPKSRGFSRLLADPEGTPADRPVDEVRALFGRLGLPGRLGDLGADLTDVMPAAEWAADMLDSDRTDLDEAAFRDVLETAS